MPFRFLVEPWMVEFGKIIVFGTTIEHGGRCEKEQPKVGPKGEGVGTTESNDTDFSDGHGWAEKRRAILGQGILKLHRPFCYANGPVMLRQKSLGENAGLRLVSKRGCVVKKHLQARLRVSFQQHIQHSHSESTTVFSIFLFDSFVPTHLALRANLRLLYRAPAPVLGCVYLGNPWFKKSIRCANELVSQEP
jgi:hypothetical protein